MPTILEEIQSEVVKLKNAKVAESDAFAAAVTHWDCFLQVIGPNLGVVAYERDGNGLLVYDFYLYFCNPCDSNARQHRAVLRVWPGKAAFLPPNGNRVRSTDSWVNLTDAITVEGAEAVMRQALQQYVKDEASRLFRS